MIDIPAIRDRYTALLAHLDERGRRSFAASEARSAGYGGIAAVARATGIAASTIGRGLKELADGSDVPTDRVRRDGGGRKPLTTNQPTLLDDLMALVSPGERGDPMSPLRWTAKSLRRLARELRERGHRISHTVVGELLKRAGFSLQANRKTREGADHPDREAQFAHINACVIQAMAANQPVISVDTKKKELVGDFKNAGREWRPQGNPETVRVHDFLIKELGRAVPYGVYDFAANAGWVSVGIDHDTAAFAVQTIRTWWRERGTHRYPAARCLTITADGGGSNGARVRLWKWELQRLADELGIAISVHHLPPGTSSRVEVWRSCCRPNVSVSAPFVWRCLTGSTLAPSPHPARQTGHADFPHPAFSCVVMPSHSAGRLGDAARHKGRASRRDTRPDIGDIRCLLVRCVEPTSVEGAVAHTNVSACRSEEPALG
jgi:transposase